MLNEFMKVDNLAQEKLLRLNDDFRYFVSPQTGQAGPKKWKVLPYHNSHVPQSLLLATYPLGTVKLQVWKKIVRFRQGSNDLWVIDTGRFAGNPKLSVKREDENIRITLVGARFPGTSIPADCDLLIFSGVGGYRIKISFSWGGFQTEVNLEQWLTGAQEAVSTLLMIDIVCPLSEAESIHLNGSPVAKFYPSWIFVVSGDGAAGFRGDSVEITVNMLALGLLGEGMPSLIPNHPVRRTWIGIWNAQFQKQFSFPLWPGREDGWSFSSNAPLHNAMAVEAGEWLEKDNPIRRVLVVTGSQSAVLEFLPGADPVGDDGEPFALPLENSVYAAGYDGEGNRLAAGLLGRLVKNRHWLHTKFCSLLLGPSPRDWFLLAEINGAVFLGHPQLMLQKIFGLGFPLLSTVVRPGGVTSDPAPCPSPVFVGLTLAAPSSPLPPDFGEVRFEPEKTSVLIRFPAAFWTIFVRPRDLLVVACRFMNLRLVSSGDSIPRLVCEGSTSPVMVVYFPPQSIGEEAFDESEGGGPLPGAPPIEARIAGFSRLAFNVVKNEMPFTLENLLDWGGSSQYLTPRLATTAQNTPALPGPGEDYPEPAPGETAIEAPFRLFVSPDQNGVWKSRALPFETNGRAELWHTRLEENNGDTPWMRAIWTSGGQITPLSNPFVMSLEPDQRATLVRQSVPEPFRAKRFMLSALGAWLDLDGKWDNTLESWEHRATLGRDHYVKVVERGYLLPFGHRAVLITITERKFQERNPGMKGAWLRKRRFIVVREPERSYPLPPESAGFQTADFRRQMPLGSVRMVTRVTPLLEPPALMEKVKNCPDTANVDGRFAFWPMVKVASGAAAERFRFHLIGTDADGGNVEFTAPLAFIRAKEKSLNPKDPAPPISDSDYAKLVGLAIDDLASDGQKENYPFGGAGVAFVKSMPGASAETDLECASMTFSAVSALEGTRPKYPGDPIRTAHSTR